MSAITQVRGLEVDMNQDLIYSIEHTIEIVTCTKGNMCGSHIDPA